MIDTTSKNTQAVILVPYRELGKEIAFSFKKIGELIGVRVLFCYGGGLLRSEIITLRRGIHVVVGTPGRILDMMKKGYIKTDFLKFIVLDDVNVFLSRGHK